MQKATKLFLDLETVNWYVDGKRHTKIFQIGFIKLSESGKPISFTELNITSDEVVYSGIWKKATSRVFFQDDYKNSEKISLEAALNILQSEINSVSELHGHNISKFDCPLLADNGITFPKELLIVDSLSLVRQFKKFFPLRLKSKSNSAQDLFRFLSKTDLDEKHSALSDCKLEWFNYRELNKRYKIFKPEIALISIKA